ncbi:hypothetical protein ACQ4LE_009071 [Meloidogyne hapla]
MKNKKTFLPAELLSEIVNFIPFNLRWSKIRVYKIFDLLIFNLLKRWIICLKFYKAEVISSLEQIKTIFSGKIDGFVCKENYIKLNNFIDYMHLDIDEWADLSPDLGLSRLFNWPVADAWRPRKDLKFCYEQRKEDLCFLFNQLFKFFKGKEIKEVRDWVAWRFVFKGKLTQARKLLEEENSAIRQDVDLVDTD